MSVVGVVTGLVTMSAETTFSVAVSVETALKVERIFTFFRPFLTPVATVVCFVLSVAVKITVTFAVMPEDAYFISVVVIVNPVQVPVTRAVPDGSGRVVRVVGSVV